MPLEELEKTWEFQRLTSKQRLFVQTYCAAGMVDGKYDAVAAIQTAYPCKSIEVARVMSYSLMGNIKIVAVLNRHFGSDPVDSFLASLDRAVRNKDLTLAQLGALRLQCEVLGYKTKIPVNPEREWSKLVRESKKEKKPRKTPNQVVTPPRPNMPQYDPKAFE